MRSTRAAEVLLAVAERLERVVLGLGRAGAWLTVPLVLVVVYDAVSRKFLRKLPFVIDTGLYQLMNSPVLQDAEWHLHTMLFFLAMGYAYATNAHVRLDILRPRFSSRARAWIELVGGAVLLLPFLVVLLRYGWEFWLSAWQFDEGTNAATGIGNRWFIKAFVLLGFGSMLLITLSVTARLLVYLAGPPALRAATRLAPYVESRLSEDER